MKMQKASHFKPVRAGLKTLKRGPCAPHTACELASAHCDTTLRFPNMPEPGLNTDALCLLLEGMLSRLVFTVLKNVYLVSFSLVPFNLPSFLELGFSIQGAFRKGNSGGWREACLISLDSYY